LLVIGLDNTIPNVAQPSLQAKLDAPTPTLRWMVDSYTLVFASLLLATPGWDASADWRALLLDEPGTAAWGMSRENERRGR
jgi:hypothetical protein